MEINDKKLMTAKGLKSSKSRLQKKGGLSVKDEVSLSSSKDEVPFYGKIRFKSGESSEKKQNIQTFNKVIALLSQSENESLNTNIELRQAGRNLDRAAGGLSFSHNDINSVRKDTENTDASSSGHNLDRTVRDVERELHGAGGRLGYADRSIDNVQNLLTEAFKELETLANKLAVSGNYGYVTGLIGKARQEINSALGNAQNVDNHIYNIDAHAGDAEKEMNRAQVIIDRIKDDRAGTDVSYHGYTMDGKVNNAEGDLGHAFRNMNSASNDLCDVNRYRSQAISTVKSALTAYSSL